jgi:hypothetical protein
MKETDTHLASPASDVLPVTTLGIDAELTSLSINSIPLPVSDIVEYMALCGETSVTLAIETSPLASMTVIMNGIQRDNTVNLPFDKGMNKITIHVVSEDEQTERTCIVQIYSPIDAGDMLFQRWNDVIAVNSNPDNNGNYTGIEGVRWYRRGVEGVASTSWVVKLADISDNYYAEIQLEGHWHRVCNEPEVRAFEKIIAYPNPVSSGDNLNLHLPTKFVGGYLNVVNLSGATMKRKLPLPNINNIINISDWSPGIYLLNITSPNGNSETVKIIVN